MFDDEIRNEPPLTDADQVLVNEALLELLGDLDGKLKYDIASCREQIAEKFARFLTTLETERDYARRDERRALKEGRSQPTTWGFREESMRILRRMVRKGIIH